MNEPLSLRATADGRCEKKLIEGGDNFVDISFNQDKYMHIVTSKTMAEQNCTPFLDRWIKLVSDSRSFSLGFCVLNFVFSLVATLGNLLVIRALVNNSTIPATVKKLFLSLAFSDLAVGLCSQLMTAIISAVMLKMASREDDVAFFCPTVLILLLYFMHLLAVASFLSGHENYGHDHTDSLTTSPNYYYRKCKATTNESLNIDITI